MSKAGVWVGLCAVVLVASGCHDGTVVHSIGETSGLPTEKPKKESTPKVQPPTADDTDTDTGPHSEPPSHSSWKPAQLLDHHPANTTDGLPAPVDGVYTDKGVAAPDMGIRGLISFPIRNRDTLEQKIRDIYDPTSSLFRKYLTAEDFDRDHAPKQEDLDTVSSWVNSTGMKVERVATNKLLLNFTGTVKQFNDAFGVELHVFERKSPQGGNAPHDVYGLVLNQAIKPPQYVKDRIHAVVALDLPADTTPLPPESGTVGPPPADLKAYSPAQIAAAYDVDKLYAAGHHGEGVKIGVAIGAAFRMRDARGFWKHLGVTRADPKIVTTMEPPATRYREGTLDVQWSGAIAPGAELIVYEGPDARNTSMIWTFNEAIARNEVDVITDSFAHREDSEARAVHQVYDASAMEAAALGITVLAASGDSSNVDVPSSSPYVTAVGGTELYMDGMNFVHERTWSDSGSGVSSTFARPWWQDGLPAKPAKRAVADVALNGGNEYYFVFLGDWWGNYGTSFASPVMAGLVATVDSARAADGKPRAGWLNPLLYTRPEVRGTFRDISEGSSWYYSASEGWDYPTGLGAPSAKGLADTLP